VTTTQSPLGQVLLLAPMMEKRSRGRGEQVKERVQRAKARPLQGLQSRVSTSSGALPTLSELCARRDMPHRSSLLGAAVWRRALALCPPVRSRPSFHLRFTHRRQVRSGYARARALLHDAPG
jgi:hypothetical protein